MPPTPVEASEAVSGAVADRFETIGSFEAGEAITVVAEIDGKVLGLPFREGQAIGKGGLIARLDDAALAAELSRAEALRDQSRATFRRVQEIVEAQAGSAQDLDDAAAALKVAEANLAVAQSRYDKTRVVAPFEGVTGVREVSPGAFLRAGEPITSLAQLRELQVLFSAPERLLPLMTEGTEIRVTTTAYPGLEAIGKITAVDPVLDAATRTARIVARLQNPGNRFRPGMSARVAATLAARGEALTVPNEAVFVEGSQAFVYSIKPDSTVTRTPVTLGTRLTDAVEIVAGLTPGAKVVRAGHQKLYEGAKVAPIMKPAQEAPTAGSAPGASSGAAPAAVSGEAKS
jgi:membrane fusion protein (multidrug efflux system)